MDVLSDPEYYFQLFVFISRQNTKNLRNLCFLSEKKTDWRFKGRYILHTNSWGSCDSRYSIKTYPIISKYYRNIECVQTYFVNKMKNYGRNFVLTCTICNLNNYILVVLIETFVRNTHINVSFLQYVLKGCIPIYLHFLCFKYFSETHIICWSTICKNAFQNRWLG